jgi:tetratricopeptide (TPR) repeat protein
VTAVADNELSGSVQGSVAQFRDAGSVTINQYPAPPPTTTPELTWTIPPRNVHFTGRVDLLARLHEQLCSGGPVAAIHSLRGMGGVGKSQLATEYAHHHAAEYDIAWWVPAEQPELIPTHLARLAGGLGIPAQTDVAAVAQQVIAGLRRRSRWLLVFDNADNPDVVRPYLPGPDGHVLVTTRRTGFSGLGAVLDVDVLTRQDSVALLDARIPALTAEQADELAGLVGDLPLALEQAAAYLDATGLPVAEYLPLLRERGGEMLAAGAVTGYPHTLATVWSLALERLDEQRPAAVELLDLCAYLAPESIPLELFTRNREQLPTALATAVGDPIAWADTVGALVGYGLVRRMRDVVSVHRLVQTAVRHRHDTPTWHQLVLSLLAADLPGEITTAPQGWARWRSLLAHVLAATDPTDPPVESGKIAWLLDSAAAYLRVRGQPGHARPLYEAALAINEAALGPDHPEVAINLNNLGDLLRNLGRPGDARPLLERALAIDEAAYGPDHPEVATDLNNLATVLGNLAQPEAARTLLERAVVIHETAYGPNHPEVATDLNNLATVLRDLAQLDASRGLLERALAIHETAYGPNHPVVSTDLNNLALALRDLGHTADVRPLLERALAIDEAAYGPDHPEIATDLYNLALVLKDLELPEAATALLERALAIIEPVYGPDHPNVLTVRRRLGLP